MCCRARIVICALAASALATATAAEPPRAKVVPFSETLHGELISDPYRWMEAETNDPDYLPWMKAQNAYAQAWLSALPKRDTLLRLIQSRSANVDSYYDLQLKGGHVFIEQRAAKAEQASLFVQEVGSWSAKLLFDPSSLDTPATGHHAIDYWEASPDGRHVYVGISTDGSELSTLRVVEVRTGKLLPEAVPFALSNYNALGLREGLYPQWLPDGSGFFYNRLAEGAIPGTPDFLRNKRVLLHRLGTDVSKDLLVMEAGKHSALNLPPVVRAFVVVQPGSETALLVARFGVQRAKAFYVAPLASVVAGEARWTLIADASQQIAAAALLGDDVYLLSLDRSRGRVLQVSVNGREVTVAREIVAEGDAVIERIQSARDGVYLLERAAAGARARKLKRNGELANVKLPFDGSWNWSFSSPQHDGLYVNLEGYVVPSRWFKVTEEQSEATDFASKLPYSTDEYVCESIMVSARDGTRVPVDIVRRRDTRKDGKRAVLLTAYGSYGINADPFFDPQLFPFLDEGAIVAVVHARGGGELGADWWHAGSQASKPNTWRDVIDSAQALIDAGWTSAGRIVVSGASAGGIVAGRAVTERPDLWAGGVADVGMMNMLRFETTANGEANVPEFGTVKTREGFLALKAMDGYLAIRDDVAYPPMLITAGMNDRRVIAWQPAKFAARMQAVSKGAPVIFKVDADQGHGFGSQNSQIEKDTADLFAFTLWAASPR